MPDLDKLLDDLLDAAVRNTTGNPQASARPAQREISHRIWDVLSAAKQIGDYQSDPAPHAAIEAPTGSGKGLAYLVPAAMLAARSGLRTLVTTESIALQTQLTTKDFPAVAEACSQMLGSTPTIAVHKGWANYPCALAAWNTAVELVGSPPTRAGNVSGRDAQACSTLASMVEGQDPLLAWALNAAADEEIVDKSQSPSDAKRWGEVSVSTDVCSGKKCPLFELCVPRRAREAAAEADIVVSNHTLLAMQAAHDIPVVIGSQTIGDIHAVVGDEAHALPGKVRDAGAHLVSGRALRQVHRSVTSALAMSDPAGTEAANVLSDQLDALMYSVAGQDKVRKVTLDEDPIAPLGDAIDIWAAQYSTLLASAASGQGKAAMDARRARSRLSTFTSAVLAVRNGYPGVARWIQTDAMPDLSGRRWAEFHASPVDVGGLMRSRLWNLEVTEGDGPLPEGENADLLDAGRTVEPTYTHSLPVVMVSATLPISFCRDAALSARIEEFESPFAAAYRRCLLYVPDGKDAPTKTYGGKRRLDTFAHEKWAMESMTRLVKANKGRALILSAKASSGRAYADHLRRALAPMGINVIDAFTTQREAAVAQWRADHHSVLVGTRGLMTGVDLAGDGNSLVVVDRIPRAANNPVDDARVELLVETRGISKWTADEMVYVSDAAALLEQAAGRQVRSESDEGMVAVLDPRLLRGELAYRESVRKIYMDALSQFVARTTTEATALRFLSRDRAGQAA